MFKILPASFLPVLPRMSVFWVISLLAVSLAAGGCDKPSYPEGKIAESLQEICRKEYGIEGVRVKFSGTTIGVYLPLEKLFTTDVKEVLMSGASEDLQSLFEPSPEAMDQLEDVLFATSRVLLSTDKKVDFYTVEATDVASTGLQLVLTGHADDVKRVRLWDIPRSEYRKRVIHELKLNRSVLWEKPVRTFFKQMTTLSLEEIETEFFSTPLHPQMVTPLFYGMVKEARDKDSVRFTIDEMKSRPFAENQALVYAKVTEEYEPKPSMEAQSFLYPSGTTLEFVFVVMPVGDRFKIARVIPFYYVDETKQLRKISLPPEFDLDRDLRNWSEEFQVEEINFGEFLAQQLNRRIQADLSADERVFNTIQHARSEFVYRHLPEDIGPYEEAPRFEFRFDFLTKSMADVPANFADVIGDEDVRYVLEIVLREFAVVMQGYHFKDYAFLELVWEREPDAAIKLNPEQIDQFRRKKIDFPTFLSIT